MYCMGKVAGRRGEDKKEDAEDEANDGEDELLDDKVHESGAAAGPQGRSRGDVKVKMEQSASSSRSSRLQRHK